MMSKEKLSRINYLAKKAKETKLTNAEKEEQATLRKEYVQNVRQSFSNQIETMTVIDPKGNDVTPEKVKQMKAKNKDKNNK